MKWLPLTLSGRRHYHRSFHIHTRDIRTPPPRTQGRKITERDRQSEPQIEVGLQTHCSGAVQTLHRTTNENANLLSHCSYLVALHGSRLRVPLPPVHHNHRSLRGPIWLFCWLRWIDLSWHRCWIIDWRDNFRYCKRSNHEKAIEKWRDESRVSSSTNDTRLLPDPYWLYALPIQHLFRSLTFPSVHVWLVSGEACFLVCANSRYWPRLVELRCLC